ncbi:hypothetical protein [Fervidibacillus albus]|uniref:Uncharacterized protein n=1 Tax=Fervidibacillus albus TaxID=2980026 RepID=A0A9E8RVE2_9BACI|nr:hypothetical protein [Fervidibacillus albus]WAA08823.1 hypothetical protein OE104_09390 [Fervidibacillus albus]
MNNQSSTNNRRGGDFGIAVLKPDGMRKNLLPWIKFSIISLETFHSLRKASLIFLALDVAESP